MRSVLQNPCRSGYAAALVVAAVLLVVTTLAGCGLGPFAVHASTPVVRATPTVAPLVKVTVLPGYTLAEPSEYTRVLFAPGVSFSQALRAVTDLGLQPVPWCLGAQWDVGAWSSSDEEPYFGPIAGGPPGGSLGVFTTAASPAGWLPQLARLPEVLSAVNGGTHCPLVPIEAPKATTGSFLGPSGVFTPALVQFAPTVSYDQALQELMALGFALNTPCAGAPPASSTDPVGQEAAFATSYALRVTTTFANSTIWHEQLAHTAGVIAEHDGASAVC